MSKTKLSDSNFYMTGFGCQKDKNKIKPFGHFEQKLIIDNELFNRNMHVVPTNCMDVHVGIGGQNNRCMYRSK